MIFQFNFCGVCCAFLAYVFLFYADYVVVVWLVLPTFVETIWGVAHVFAYNCIVFMAMLSHLRTMLTDPGVVPPSVRYTSKPELSHCIKIEEDKSDDEDYTDSDNEQGKINKSHNVGDDWTLCAKCDSYRPPRAHHCRVCRRCIRKMDHHCPWVNNCVGEFNQKYFLQFIFYVATLAVYSIGLIVLSWIFHDDHGLTGEYGPIGRNAYNLKVIHSIALTIESALFGLFVLAMSCDQLQAIFNDETVVEAFQRRGLRRRRIYRSKYSLLSDVCGPDHWMYWILPCNSIPSKRDFIHFAQDLRTL